MKIAPSILTADFGNLSAQIKSAERGGADYIHLDVMDGRFVPNISFGPTIVKAVRQSTSLPLDVHLMMLEPDRYLAQFADAGTDIITVHVEACTHLHRVLEGIADVGCKRGVVLNPATPISAIEEVLPMLDIVLLMSVNPGFGGQKFIESTKDKLRRMRRVLDDINPSCELEVDGGVGAGNIVDVAASGANVLVVGSAVYNDVRTPEDNVAMLRRLIV
ncbi:MAG: ribulose-phosphate 3-epimerase [Chloroflexota bacterium]